MEIDRVEQIGDIFQLRREPVPQGEFQPEPDAVRLGIPQQNLYFPFGQLHILPQRGMGGARPRPGRIGGDVF